MFDHSHDSTLSAVTKVRLLDDMLGGLKVEGTWSILLLDSFTTQIMTNICGVSDLLDYGVSLVENIKVSRQSSKQIAAIYFITPTDENVDLLTKDFSKRKAQFRAVHVFFTSAALPQHLEKIKATPKLLERLETLKEANLEYIVYPDRRSFVTAQEDILRSFYAPAAEMLPGFQHDVRMLAQRLASVFVTMKEFPCIRYRAALPPGDEYPDGLESRLLATQQVAVELADQLADYQQMDRIPDTATCELIILDRGFDVVSPIIHEWTYEAMIHDVLEQAGLVQGKVYHDTSGKTKSDAQEYVLDEKDPLYLELRHRHVAEASTKISSNLDSVLAKSNLRGSVADLDLRKMAKLVQSLPKYQDDMRTLSVHIEIASELNKLIEANRLMDFGALEQDIVFGDSTSKDLISFLSTNQLMDTNDKLRLLMCYSATHQEKLDGPRQSQWKKLARLSDLEMRAVMNLEYLGIPVCKRQKSGLSSISFGKRRRRATRKEKNVENLNNDNYSLSRYVPLLAELLEDMATRRLSQDEYPIVNPSASVQNSVLYGGNSSSSESSRTDGQVSSSKVTSFRTFRPAGTWATKANSQNSPEQSISRTRSKRLEVGQEGRIFVFVIGGFTFSELRTVHHLSTRFNKDIFLGGTSVLTPSKLIDTLSHLAG